MIHWGRGILWDEVQAALQEVLVTMGIVCMGGGYQTLMQQFLQL